MFCWCRVHIHGLRLIKDALNCRCHLCLCWGVPRLIDGGDILDAQLLIIGLSLTGFRGVWYLATASWSSGVLRWVWVNPGGTLSASVGCRVSGCPDGSWSLPAAPAHDGVVKLRSEGTLPIVIRQWPLAGSACPMWGLVPTESALSPEVRNRDKLGSRM